MGVNVCPFYLKAPEPAQNPVDPDEPFGLVLGDVYRFKDGGPDASEPGNRGFLGIYGSGGNVINTGIANGCVPTDPTLDIEIENGESITSPKQGNQASTWNAINSLYAYEGTGTFPSQSYCDIAFDSNAFVLSDGYYHILPTDPNVAQKLLDCRHDPDPTDNVEGRWWPILISTAPCNGNSCTVTIKAIAMMYVACWGPRCDGSNPGQAGLFGIFMTDLPFELPATGVSNNPLAPKRVRLVR